jgi:hemoglobin-like flavoprotein
MNSLELEASELSQLKLSWSQLQANNKYQKDEFVSRVYSNLIAANPNLKTVFAEEDTIREHSMLFDDILRFVLSYVDDNEMLNEFMYQFIQENELFANVAVEYLEPMGGALIQTFKQWLGNGKFDSEIEIIWIKVYVFIANSILSVDDLASEVSSTFSNKELSNSEEEDVAPLNIFKPEPVAEPVAEQVEVAQPKQSILDRSNTIQFHLNSNEKYRGFRRSVQSTPAAEAISVKIPTTNTFQKILTSSNISPTLASILAAANSPIVSQPAAPFDPRIAKRGSRNSSLSSSSSFNGDSPVRSLRRSAAPSIDLSELEEPKITPRSSRRNSVYTMSSSIEVIEEPKIEVPIIEQPSLLKKLQLRQPQVIQDSSDEEDEEEAQVETSKFDPRRRSHKRANSVCISPEFSEIGEQEDGNHLSRGKTSTFVEGFEEEEEVKPLPAVPVVPAGRFDYNSFGLKGLDPIVEQDFDDTTSSKYESEDDSNSSHYAADASVTDRSSTDDNSSSASTLSLHHSDDRSFSSGNESNSPIIGKLINGHTMRQPSQSSDISYMQPLDRRASVDRISSISKNYNHSASSLLLSPKVSEGPQLRASMGFMRSSFVLKQEMEVLGFNLPENVFEKPPTLPVAKSSIDLTSSAYHKQKTASSFSVNSAVDSVSIDNNCFDLINAFVPESSSSDTLSQALVRAQTKRKILGSHIRSTSNMSTNHVNASLKYREKEVETSSKRGLRQRLSSMFSSKRSSASSASSGIMSRKSSMSSFQRDGNASVSDLISINSVSSQNTSCSGFSFMNRSQTTRNSVSGRRGPTKKGGKYQVVAVPYDVFSKA